MALNLEFCEINKSISWDFKHGFYCKGGKVWINSFFAELLTLSDLLTSLVF